MNRRSVVLRCFRVALALVAGLFVATSALAFQTIVVTSNSDAFTGCAGSGTGECTLRDAILFSNAHPQPFLISNLIQFNIPGSGVHTIALTSNLPTITTAVVIDGYSQPGASANTLGVGDNAVLLISIEFEGFTATRIFEIDDGTGGAFSGRTVGGSVIRGLVLNHGDSTGNQGIVLNSCCNRIEGNFIGTDPTGNPTLMNNPGGGQVEIRSAANVIGGSTPSVRNVIVGLESGLINIRGNVNVVKGNYIGTNASGTAGLSNIAFGVFVDGQAINSQGNTIGGPTADDRNVISGNRGAGIGLVGQGALGNLIASNFIGTDATGLGPIPNGIGVVINGAEGNSVGMFSSPTTGNRIAFNGSVGVLILEEKASSAHSRFNTVLYNSIFSNGSLGIDLSVGLSPDGVTPNDDCDADSGPNDLQNYPVLTAATALKFTTEIEGTLNSVPNKTYLIQLFSNTSCDPSGFGQGEKFVGELFVTTDGACNASFNASVPVADAPAGQFITATATDLDGNTSEFSACQVITTFFIPTRLRFLVEGPIHVAPGVPVQFRFKVEPQRRGETGDFSGEVVVSDDQGDVCHAEVSSTGEGACPLTFATPGNYRVRAHYLGNASFEESTSPPVPVLVGMPGGPP